MKLIVDKAPVHIVDVASGCIEGEYNWILTTSILPYIFCKCEFWFNFVIKEVLTRKQFGSYNVVKIAVYLEVSAKCATEWRCEVELKFTVHYSLFGPNSEL